MVMKVPNVGDNYGSEFYFSEVYRIVNCTGSRAK